MAERTFVCRAEEIKVGMPKIAKIRQLSVAGLLAETILRIFSEDSVSSLFVE